MFSMGYLNIQTGKDVLSCQFVRSKNSLFNLRLGFINTYNSSKNHRQ
jgi:hypothetical protein